MSAEDVLTRMRKMRDNDAPWQLVADRLNERYGVDLSKSTYRNWLEKGIEPADKRVRRAFGLGPRACPTCHRKENTPRHSIKRTQMTPEMHWWRNQLTSRDRRETIKSLFYSTNRKRTR